MDGPLPICILDAVGNGHVTSNGACLHSTPSSAGLSEADEQQQGEYLKYCIVNVPLHFSIPLHK